MTAVYAGIVAVPFRLSARPWRPQPTAGATPTGSIRKLVGFNLIVGFVTIAVATLGRWL